MAKQAELMLDLHEVIAMTGHRNGEQLWLDVKAGLFPDATEPKVKGRKSRWKLSAIPPVPPADEQERERVRAREAAGAGPEVEMLAFDEVLVSIGWEPEEGLRSPVSRRSMETLRKMVHKGLFPKPVWVKHRGRPWWRSDEVMDWLRLRDARRRQHAEE